MKNTTKYLIGLSVVLVASNITMHMRFYHLNNNFNQLFNRIYQIDGNINNSIAEISSTVLAAINAENSLVEKFKYEYGKFKDGMIDLNLTVNLKEISSENKYFFSYMLDGKEILTEAKVMTSSVISADVMVPVNQTLDLNFIIENKETKKIESLNDIYAAEEGLVEPFISEYIGGQGFTYHYTGNILELSEAGFSIAYSADEYREDFLEYDYNEEDNREDFLEDVSLYIALNGEVIDSFPMEKSEDPPWPYLEEYTFTFHKYSLKLKPKDKLDIYALAKHLDGYEVKIILEAYELGEDGELNDNRELTEKQKTIIY